MARKRSSTTGKETKPQRLAREVAKAVGAGVPWHLKTVDFADPNRPKTCLEVDFPIVPINHIASLEATSGAAKKPIYQMSKWWARRQSSVFRAMLIAAAAKAPEDPAEAARLVWNAYYGNHQDNASLSALKCLDLFMGGGTTIVEGDRLGFAMHGADLNPIAWLVVHNEIANVNEATVRSQQANVETSLRSLLMPFYACGCPWGHQGTWTHVSTGEVMGTAFDPSKLSREERSRLHYNGPEIVFTFWAKHSPCQGRGCNHRTPIMTSPVFATKSLSVKVWPGKTCTKCNEIFDIERDEARLAPLAKFVVAPGESAYAVMDDLGTYACPHCGHQYRDAKAKLDGESVSLGKARSKEVKLSVLVHPDWMLGIDASSFNSGIGGSATDSAESTAAWNLIRQESLSHIEVRGDLPPEIRLDQEGLVLYTDHRGGTMPKKAAFACQSSTCGLKQDVYDSLGRSGKTGPVAVYAIQVYCPLCEASGRPGKGRYFSSDVPVKALNAAIAEWEHRKDEDLSQFWPREEIPYGLTTHIDRPLPDHGFTHWWTMFNPRQLLVNASLLQAINRQAEGDCKLYLLGAFQQFLRCNNMFTIWHQTNNQMSAFLSSSNFAPKLSVVEVSPFAPVGDGTWRSAAEGLYDSIQWKSDPWELVPKAVLEPLDAKLAASISGKSHKAYPNDSPLGRASIDCCSATDLTRLESGSFDLVVTDPPFGGLLQYSELSDFFYVWLKRALGDSMPNIFSAAYSPKTLEAVANKARHPDDADLVYKRLLTMCWSESYRVLKPGGLLAFTFHHSEDEPWVAVLESLFNSGFYLEATYPIRSDESKGDGDFGSQQIEFDIIHVCRKRNEILQPISWARLRRLIIQDVRHLKALLNQHHQAGLQEADLQVIRRGKALEYYSRHYGKVYVERGRDFPVKDALLAINQMLDEEVDSTIEAPPAHSEAYTRQFFRLFADRDNLPRDQMQKHLRGTGVSPQEFVDRGWCVEKQKVFFPVSPSVWASTWKGVARTAMSRDFDQAMFLVGACFDGSGLRVSDTLNNPRFEPHPATGDLLDWLIRHGGNADIKSAAQTARQLYQTWLSKRENQDKLRAQQLQFGFDEAGE